MNIIAQTPRIYVREFQPGELDLLLAIDGDERLTKYVKKRSAEESKRVFKDTIKAYKEGASLGRWGIFNVADDDFIGLCMLKPSDYDASQIEIGYRLHLKYWGIGIATELTKVLVTYGLDELKLKEICAVTHPDNIASQRVLEKAGLIKQGTVFWYNEDLPFFKVENKGL